MSLSPYFDHAPDLILYVRVGAFVGDRCSLGDDRIEGFEKLFLLADLGLLYDLYVL